MARLLKPKGEKVIVLPANVEEGFSQKEIEEIVSKQVVVLFLKNDEVIIFASEKENENCKFNLFATEYVNVHTFNEPHYMLYGNCLLCHVNEYQL